MSLETILPALDAGLIAASGLSLLVGFAFIRREIVTWHKRFMLAAAGFAALFLIVYLIRWALLGSQPFTGEGALRTAYLAVLISHMALAIAIVPLVIITLRRALRGDFRKHKRMARVTFPIWLYVAASGWAVYWMLYHLSG